MITQQIYQQTWNLTTQRQHQVYQIPYVNDLRGLKMTLSLSVTANANGAVALTPAGEWAGIYELKVKDRDGNEAIKLHGPEVPIVRRHFADGIQKVYIPPAGANASISASSSATYTTTQPLRLSVKGPNLLELTFAQISDITSNTGNVSSASVTLSITADYGDVAKTIKLNSVVLPASVQGDNNMVPYLTGAKSKKLEALILFGITESDFVYFTQKSGAVTLVDQASLAELEADEASVFPNGHVSGTLDILPMYRSVVTDSEQLIVNWNTAGLMPTAIFAYTD
jgi:hypothetical protein